LTVETMTLGGTAPGTVQTLQVHRFGTPGGRPKVYVQAALHADEVPGMLVAQHLIGLMRAHDAAGRIRGEVVVAPLANPIGVQQRVAGTLLGRFNLTDGVNFNRGYPDLADAAADAVAGCLEADPAANAALVRTALLDANAAVSAATPADHLKRALLGLALDADLVLDLHCENEGVVHLYTLTPLADRCRPLAALLGAQALLLADLSGGNPFDEACSRPWLEVRRRFPAHPIPLGCCAVTVELRGEADVSDALAAADAGALVDAMTLSGAIDAPVPALPAIRCRPTNLADVELLVAPVPGVLLLHLEPGASVEPGDLVAEVVDPLTGSRTALHARYAGVLFAQESVRFVAAGRAVAKIAGTEAGRSGALLGA
jgi:predicted deacylase